MSSSRPEPGDTQQQEQDESAELHRRIVRTLRLDHHLTQRIALIVLGVLVATCLLATLTRLSALPLVPLSALAIAGYGLYRVRRAGDDRMLVIWSSLTVSATLVGFWLMSVIGRALDS